MRLALGIALCCGIACQNGESPGPDVFTCDFVLAGESDWAGGQSCQYVMPVDQTVCSWGRLTVSVDTVVRSVFGSDVHQGGQSGPLVHQDSVAYAFRVGVGNVCTLFIAGNTVKPNGPGVLAADSLRFAGHDLLGDTVRWVYAPVQVQRPKQCG